MSDTPPPSNDPQQPATPPPPPPPPAGSDPNATVPYASQSTPSGYPGPYTGPAPTKDDQNMGLLTHILGIFTGFLGPLIIWLVKKDQSVFIDDQGKETLNFKITTLLAYLVAGALSCLFIGLFIIPVIFLLEVIFGIMGAMANSRGEAYRYPFALRLVK
jgi:uncharacterized Tic20 family protein